MLNSIAFILNVCQQLSIFRYQLTIVMLAAFVCNVLFDVNLLIIIIVCGALGYMIERAIKKEGGLQ